MYNIYFKKITAENAHNYLLRKNYRLKKAEN